MTSPPKKRNFPSNFGYSRGEFSTFLTSNVVDIWPLTTKKLFFSQIESIKECKKAKNVLFIVVYIWYFWILNPSKRWLLYAHFDRSVHFGGGRWTIYHKGVLFPNFFVFLTFSRYISNVISSYFTVFSKNMSMRVSWFWQKHESWGLFSHFLIKLTLVYLYIFNVFKTNLQ